jgi:hypothetical protein
VTIKECQHVGKEYSLNYVPNQEDTDDFDGDEDEPTQNLKLSGIAGMACSMIPKIQEHVGNKF